MRKRKKGIWIAVGGVIVVAVVAVLVLRLMFGIFGSGYGHVGITLASGTIEQSGGQNRPQASDPIARRGGVPIVSISYADGIHIDCSSPLVDFSASKKQINRWIKGKTISEAEQAIREMFQPYLEVWVDMGDFPVDDPAMQDPPILLDNERIERKTGRDWLVTTLAYFDIHIYNMNFNEGDFITKINGVDAGVPTGNWWE